MEGRLFRHPRLVKGGCVGVKSTHGRSMGTVWQVGLGDVRRPTANGERRVVGAAGLRASRGLAMGPTGVVHRSITARLTDQPSLACLGVRVRRVRRRADQPCATSRARGVLARSGAKRFQHSTVDHNFSQDFVTEVDQWVNRKVIDCSTLYNFYNGRIWFFSTNFA
jgi:hypothetical protein